MGIGINMFYDYVLGAAHASLQVQQLWPASEVRKPAACQRLCLWTLVKEQAP